MARLWSWRKSAPVSGYDLERRHGSARYRRHPEALRDARRDKAVREGRFEVLHIGGLTIGRATYEPGWRWSEHVGPAIGQTRCAVEHVGLVISGTATAAFDDGRVFELHAGQAFYIPPVPHDSWVIGDAPYVSLHFLGAEKYAGPTEESR